MEIPFLFSYSPKPNNFCNTKSNMRKGILPTTKTARNRCLHSRQAGYNRIRFVNEESQKNVLVYLLRLFFL